MASARARASGAATILCTVAPMLAAKPWIMSPTPSGSNVWNTPSATPRVISSVSTGRNLSSQIAEIRRSSDWFSGRSIDLIAAMLSGAPSAILTS